MKKKREKKKAKGELNNDCVIIGTLMQMLKNPLTTPQNREFAKNQLKGFSKKRLALTLL
ncbi:MAG: hypothetical protein Q7U36_04455 [bacterium]|nr:hypothetical protein [bacterium]